MEQVIKNSIHDIDYFWSDRGKEFYNRGISNLLAKYKIHQYFTNSEEIKCSLAERVIKTIKRKISKYILEFNSSFIGELDKITASYNLSPHGSLMNNSPLDIYLMSDVIQIQNLTMYIYELS